MIPNEAIQRGWVRDTESAQKLVGALAECAKPNRLDYTSSVLTDVALHLHYDKSMGREDTTLLLPLAFRAVQCMDLKGWHPRALAVALCDFYFETARDEFDALRGLSEFEVAKGMADLCARFVEHCKTS